jgi:hypothetical protein
MAKDRQGMIGNGHAFHCEKDDLHNGLCTLFLFRKRDFFIKEKINEESQHIAYHYPVNSFNIHRLQRARP